MNRQFDIIIVGAGMVGLTLANLLKHSKLSIALIDTHEPVIMQRAADEHDLRVSAITRASQQIFETTGAWSFMQQLRVTAYDRMHVWDATGNGEISFDAASAGTADLGHIIENNIIVSGLTSALQQQPNIHWFMHSRCENLSRDTQQVVLKLDDLQTLEARLLIGADGGNSWVRKQYGIETTGWAYQQTGVVCTVSTGHSHQHTAWQRFLPTGPVAFLPMDNDYSSIVWSLSSDTAQSVMQLNDSEFLQALNEAIGESALGKVISTSKRAAFPLRLSHTHHYTGPRMALIGDAAHSIHPLAGQGVNLGIMDAAALADELLHTLSKKRDIGHQHTLRRYERQRKGQNLGTMAVMDSFKRLFSNEDPWLTLLRNHGLNTVNASSTLKNLITKQAMGLEQTR